MYELASVHNILESKHTQIHASFQASMSMLEQRFKEKMLCFKLVKNISKNLWHFLARQADRALGRGTNKSKCGCIIFITYGFPCAFTIAKKIKLNTPCVWMKLTLTRRDCDLSMMVALQI